MTVVDHGLTPPADWDGAVEGNPRAWFWHRRAWLDYSIAYDDDLLVGGSIFSVRDGDCIAGTGAVLVERDPANPDRVVVGLGGGPAWAPSVAPHLDRRARLDVLQECMAHIDEVARGHEAVYGRVRVSPLLVDAVDHGVEVTTIALRAGWDPRGELSQVLDVSRSSDDVRRSMTKGHRSAITQGLKRFEVNVFDDTNPSTEAFDAYREMHRLAAGRSTRPEKTWTLMSDWLSIGHGLLAGARADGEWAGFAYVLIDGRGAYYASAANHPDRQRDPVGQALQGVIIDHLRGKGVVTYELGHQAFGPSPHAVPSDKELAIARFKRGFGGVATPVVELERWWDAGAARDDLVDRANRFATALEHPVT